MAALALADALMDFGLSPRPAAAGTRPETANSEHPRMGVVEAASPAPDPQTIQAEVEKAEAAITERLGIEHAQMLEAAEERHKAELAALHAEFGERAGAALVGQLAEMESRIIALTSSVAARILGIAMTENVQHAALDALAASITDAIADREALRIKVRGPLSLYEPLQAKLGRLADQVDFAETSGFDITVSIDDTLFETRLSEWSAALSEIME